MTAPQAIPKPQNITAYHRAGWAYLIVPSKHGFSQEVQYKSPGSDWEDASRYGSEWLVPMQQQLRTEFRARYTRPGETGQWATGRVWMPDGFEVNSGGVKPDPPRNLNTSGIGGNVVRIDWAKPATAPEFWRVGWRREGHKHWSSKIVHRGDIEIVGDRNNYTIRDLARYTTYEITVRAVAGGTDSDPAGITVLTTAREDDGFGPATPYNGTADTVTADSASVSWDQDDPRAVKKWLIGIPGHGPLEEVRDQEYTLTDLKPGTGYTAHVFAVGYDDSYATGSAEISFTTKDGGTPGGKRPEWIRKTNASTSTTLAVEWERRGDETQWAVRLDGNPLEYVPGDDTPEFSWAGLEPGSEHSVEVRCQVNGVWLPRDTAKKVFFVLDEGRLKPEPPTGLHFHCIADVTAKAQWDQNGDVDSWEVWIDDDRAEGAISTVTPLVPMRNLEPATTYTVHVVAQVGHPGDPNYQESEPTSGSFTTLETVLPPDEEPAPIPGDLAPPKNLMVRAVSDSELDATWTELRPDVGADSQFYVVTVDGVRWERVNAPTVRFTDLQPGTHTVHVYGVINNRLTGIARKATTLKEAAA